MRIAISLASPLKLEKTWGILVTLHSSCDGFPIAFLPLSAGKSNYIYSVYQEKGNMLLIIVMVMVSMNVPIMYTCMMQFQIAKTVTL